MARPVEKELSFKNIRLLKREELGRGSFGFVCKAQCDQLICAAKVIYDALREAVAPDPGREHRQPHRRFESEIDFLKHVHHPNIVQYLGTYEDPDSGDLALLMELMDESLTHFLESSAEDTPYHTQVNLSYDVAQALAFLHTNGIIHRDLSSNNVLLLAGTRAKVTDFGMSKFAERNVSLTLSPGTPAFMPPEALNQPPVYTEKLDNFSFGVLLVQIVTRKFPEPTERLRTRRLSIPGTNQSTLQVPVPEAERRHGHISLIQQDHPLLPTALDCLKDEDQERPSSQELCGRLSSLKRSERYATHSQQNLSASSIREQLQTQNQQHQAEIKEKIEQLQSKDLQIQTQNQEHLAEIRKKTEQIQAQHQAEIREKTQAQNQQHQAEIRGKNEELQAKDQQIQLERQQSEAYQQQIQAQERELAALKERLKSNEEVTASLQQELINRDKQPQGRETQSQTGNSKTPAGVRIVGWHSLPGAPNGIEAGSAVVIATKLYIKSGSSDLLYIHEFDSKIDKWSKLPKHPLMEFTIVNVNGTLTTVGGKQTIVEYSKKLYGCYEGSWIETLPEIPTGRRTPAAVFANNTLVVAGGYNDKHLSTVEVLDISRRIWCSVSSLPFAASQLSACILDDHIYIHTGFTRSEVNSVVRCSLAALVKSAPKSGAWESIAPVPVFGTSLINVRGYLLAVGGRNASEATNTVLRYNKATNSWTVVIRMSVARYKCLAALLPDNRLLVVGGNHGGISTEVATIIF